MSIPAMLGPAGQILLVSYFGETNELRVVFSFYFLMVEEVKRQKNIS